MLLVDVTGRPFPELLRDTVLEPLGMSASTYEQPLPEREAAKVDPKLIDWYLGDYDLGLMGGVKVQRDQNRVVAKSSISGELELFMGSDTDFFTEDPGVTGKFVVDDQGNVKEVIVNLVGQTVKAKRIR